MPGHRTEADRARVRERRATQIAERLSTEEQTIFRLPLLLSDLPGPAAEVDWIAARVAPAAPGAEAKGIRWGWAGHYSDPVHAAHATALLDMVEVAPRGAPPVVVHVVPVQSATFFDEAWAAQPAMARPNFQPPRWAAILEMKVALEQGESPAGGPVEQQNRALLLGTMGVGRHGAPVALDPAQDYFGEMALIRMFARFVPLLATSTEADATELAEHFATAHGVPVNASYWGAPLFPLRLD